MAEDVMNLRMAVKRGVVQSIDDTGQVQTAVVKLGDGNVRTCEVWQIDGFANVPSGDGAIALVLFAENDPSQPIALLANPSTRFGGQASGERAIAAPDGTRVKVRQGGTVEIWGGNVFNVNAPNCTINAADGCTINAAAGCTINAASGCTINGPLTLNGDITLNGSMVATGNIHSNGTISDAHGTL